MSKLESNAHFVWKCKEVIMFQFVKNIINKIKHYFFKRKMTKFIRYYRSHPTEFAEKYLGCKLYSYQKELLNKIYKSN